MPAASEKAFAYAMKMEALKNQGKRTDLTSSQFGTKLRADAKENAKINGIKNAEFILGGAEEIAPRLAESGICPDVIIVDPPRKGLDREAITAIGKMLPSRVVYVSCNQQVWQET